SGVLYVDLTNESSAKLLTSKVMRVTNGFTHGEIQLSDSLRDGIYTIRSYTNWMRNFSKDLYFTQRIRVFRGTETVYDDEKLSKLSSVADLKFFPEGGNLVSGINGRIAFKALNVAGNGVDVKGYVLNSKRDTVVIFNSRHLGMGYFGFTP